MEVERNRLWSDNPFDSASSVNLTLGDAYSPRNSIERIIFRGTRNKKNEKSVSRNQRTRYNSRNYVEQLVEQLSATRDPEHSFRENFKAGANVSRDVEQVDDDESGRSPLLSLPPPPPPRRTLINFRIHPLIPHEPRSIHARAFLNFSRFRREGSREVVRGGCPRTRKRFSRGGDRG